MWFCSWHERCWSCVHDFTRHIIAVVTGSQASAHAACFFSFSVLQGLRYNITPLFDDGLKS
ncbi:MAG TPA: hypothetical protein VG962_02470 [Steroidobacteraceae bacterium]|nr:hypothetical protein [Steroidobacteraceae bacterium]